MHSGGIGFDSKIQGYPILFSSQSLCFVKRSVPEKCSVTASIILPVFFYSLSRASFCAPAAAHVVGRTWTFSSAISWRRRRIFNLQSCINLQNHFLLTGAGSMAAFLLSAWNWWYCVGTKTKHWTAVRWRADHFVLLPPFRERKKSAVVEAAYITKKMFLINSKINHELCHGSRGYLAPWLVKKKNGHRDAT